MSTSYRFTGAKNNDNTDRLVKRDSQTLAYAASVACVVSPYASKTLFTMTLAGALTLTINVGTSTTPPMVGDEVDFIILSDSSIRVITFSTGFLPAGTLTTVASKSVTASFRFNGTAWLETSRSIQA